MGEDITERIGGSLTALRRLVLACDLFEAGCRAGERPRIEDLLEDVPVEERSALRRELEALEQTYFSGAPESRISVGSDTRTATTVGIAAPGSRSERRRDAPTLAMTAAPAPASPTAGAMLGDYELLERIGGGGMGVVYRAHQRGVQRVVALKLIRREWAEDMTADLVSEAVDRFRTETLAVGRLEHDHIVPIYEFGEDGDRHFFSMRYVEGESLSGVLRRGPLPSRKAASLLVPLARALAYAHAQGVIHRDLKPGNILIDVDGKPYLADFGLAKLLLADDPHLTRTQAILGSPPYMSPEQARDASKVGPAGDIYSLGATLYETLTGRPPFRAADPLETLRQVLDEAPAPPRQLNPAVHCDLETICLKCLEKDPARRYPTADALADDLQRFLDGQTIRARAAGTVERTVRWVRRRPLIAALLATVVAVTGVGFAGVTWQWQQAEAGRRRLEVNAYFDHITLAAEALAAGRVDRADQLLKECPGPLKDWEWWHLRRRRNDGPMALRDHPSALYGVAFRPDRRVLVAAGRLGTVRLWDTATGRSLGTLPDVPGDTTVREVDWSRSPGGKQRIVAACEDGFVRLWDEAPGGWSLRGLSGHSKAVVDAEFEPSGRRFVSGGEDGKVILWDPDTGRPIASATLSKSALGGVAIDPKGRWIAAGGKDRTVRLWDAETGQVRVLGRHNDAISTVAFSPDGRRLAAVDFDGAVIVRDVASGGTVLDLEGHFDGVNSVTFSPDGRRIATAGADGLIKLWDAATGREALTLRGHAKQAEGLAFSRDGQLLASAGVDGTVFLWDASPTPDPPAPRPRTLHGHEGAVQAVAVSADGASIASAGDDGTVRVWDAASGQIRAALTPAGEHPEQVNAVAFDPAGRWLASGGRDAFVRLWQPSGPGEIDRLRGHTDRVIALAVGPGGVLASGGRDKVVRLWEVEGRRELRRCGPLTDEIYSLAFDPSGRRLASACADGTVRVWDHAGEDEPIMLPGHSDEAYALAFDPSGRRLASASADGTTKVWDVATGREVMALRGHASRVWNVAYSLDGRFLATAGGDHTVRVWDARSGRELAALRGHTSRVYAVAFDPNSRYLVSVGGDRTVKLWQPSDWGAGP